MRVGASGVPSGRGQLAAALRGRVNRGRARATAPQCCAVVAGRAARAPLMARSRLGAISTPEEGSCPSCCSMPPAAVADPPTIEEIVAVMRRAGDSVLGRRLRGLIVVLWRAGLRIHEALALAEADL